MGCWSGWKCFFVPNCSHFNCLWSHPAAHPVVHNNSQLGLSCFLFCSCSISNIFKKVYFFSSSDWIVFYRCCIEGGIMAMTWVFALCNIVLCHHGSNWRIKRKFVSLFYFMMRNHAGKKMYVFADILKTRRSLHKMKKGIIFWLCFICHTAHTFV